MQIELEAYYGNEVKKVVISNPSGSGSIYHLMIDNYFYGSINKMSDGWHVYFNSDDFTGADESILLDILHDLKAI